MNNVPLYLNIDRNMPGFRGGMRFLLLALFLVTGMMLTSCDDDDKKTASAARTVKDVSYGPYSDNTLDLFLPAGRSSSTKVVLFIHGGGWIEGSKEQFTDITNDFVASGYAVASINYRPANADLGISYIDLLKDIDQSLLFLREESDEYVFNPNHVTLFGHSAGAHLALLYAYRDNTRGQVKSVVSLSAPTDLTALLEENVFPTLLYNLVGSDAPSQFVDASPVTHVKSGVVPTLIIHGRADTAVPYQQSELLYQKLSASSKGSSQFELLDDVGHDFPAETLEMVAQASIDYISNR